MIRILFLVFMIMPAISHGQFTYQLDQSIPVKDINGNNLTMPWAGGLNAAQYNMMDLDEDNIEDLVLYDRMADKVVTFLSVNKQYKYAPEYESLFPEDISNWLLLRDYNCDGKKDIFTGDILGIKVFINTTESGQPFSWKQFLFSTGFAGSTKSNVLLTKGFSAKINLQIQFDDLPAIVDADNDGDLDIFNMRFVGNGTVEFHKNFSMERYGTCDSLDFERITQTWGNIKECSCGKFALNGTDCPAGGRVKHAGGKSLLALDVDGDSQLDLLFSEATCAQLFLFKNEGTLLNPVVNSFSFYPTASPVSFALFPAAYLEDVDHDGKKDFIATPNIFAKQFGMSYDLNHSNWFYRNTGSASVPQFTPVQKDFLQENMIDLGDNSIPAFADYDGDGDYDMFVSRNSSINYSSTIFLYENTGSAKAPSFTLTTDDYLGFAHASYYNLKLQFVDINGDNALDLVFTATGFDNGVTTLNYVINTSQSKLDFGNQTVSAVEFDLTYNENIYLTDVNADGKTDLLVGRSNGALEYWKNDGASIADHFSLENNKFLGLGSSVLRQNISCFVADLDSDGKADLIFGDQTGELKIISDFHNTTDPTPITDVVYNSILKDYTRQNLGGKIWPVVVNLFNSSAPDIVSGNVLGGIEILRNDKGESLPDDPALEVYPNPVIRTKTDILNIKTDRPAFVEIVSLLGQRVGAPLRIVPNLVSQYKIPDISPGLYLLKFTVNNKSFSKRLVIVN